MQGSKPLSAPQKALRKLGLARDIDLALHLPLRYEDETRLTRLREAREADTVQIEGTVTANEIAYRPRRQLVVTLDDGTDTCQLRFFSFYPAQQTGQFTKDAIDRFAATAIEQARGAAFGGGVLGDQPGGQGEIEVADGVGAHA